MCRLLFSADDGLSGRELWVTDGTPEGTQLLADAWPGGGPGNPGQVVQLAPGLAVFAATDPAFGTEPWMTDGTSAGTGLLRDINTGLSGFMGSAPRLLTALGDGRAVFLATGMERGSGLWVTDGTWEGTQPIPLDPDDPVFAGGVSPTGIVPLTAGQALFAGFGTGIGNELWTTDGTGEGTRLVKDIWPGEQGSFPGTSYASSGTLGMAALGDGRAVFAADDGASGRELWVSDGTEAGTLLVADLWAGGSVPYEGAPVYPFGSNPSNFTLLEPGVVLFTATEPTHANELWVTDGTAEGTRLVKDIAAVVGTGGYVGTGYPSTSSYPAGIIALGDGRALFSAFDNDLGRELWITDGTEEGTRLVADIWPGGGSATPGSSYGTPYFAPVPYPYPAYVSPGSAVALGDGRAVFAATDPVFGTEPWVSDGTEGGTMRLADINAGMQGFAGSIPRDFTALGDGRAVFVADDGIHGAEPWITDGTPEGTRLLRDIRPDLASSGPGGFVLLEDAPPPEEPPLPPDVPFPGPSEGVTLPGDSILG